MHTRAVAAVVLLAIVVVTTLAILLTQQNTVTPPVPEPPADPTRTLLVQVRDPGLLARGSVLMGLDDERLNQLWWTADWWVDQIGVQEVSGAEMGRKTVAYVMQTVQDQVQVRVDDAWVLDRLAFAGLVDAVGGVRIDVPEQVIYLTDRRQAAVLPQGVQTLDGAVAADYVLDAALRDEQQRLTRFQAVWDQVLRRFPSDPERARTLIVSLGALSKATMPTEELALLLQDARDLRIVDDYAQTQVVLAEDNSVRVRPPQGVRRAYAVNAQATGDVVGDVFGGFPVPPDPVARIQAVQVRAPTAATIRAQLLTRSWQSAWGGRAITAATSVTVDPSVPAAEVVGLEQALGIEPTVEKLPLSQARVDVEADDGLPVGL